LKAFGLNHELFHAAGEKLGGKKAAMGDVSMSFWPFPKIPVTLLLWMEDGNFPLMEISCSMRTSKTSCLWKTLLFLRELSSIN